MNAMLHEFRQRECEFEDLWQCFHRAWVSASEQLAEAEERAHYQQQHQHQHQQQHGNGHGPDEHTLSLLHALRQQERQQRLMLERFEHRFRLFRSRTDPLRSRY